MYENIPRSDDVKGVSRSFESWQLYQSYHFEARRGFVEQSDTKSGISYPQNIFAKTFLVNLFLV